MAKPVSSRKITVNRKAVSAVTLIVLIALTVIFVFLGINGRDMDKEGLYKLLPWLPTTGTEARWREALVPGAELGETLVMNFKADAENALTEEEKAETVRVLSARLRDLGWLDARVEALEDNSFRATMPQAADDGHLAHLLDARGEFTFADPEGNVFLDGKHVQSAAFGMTSANATDYSLSLAFDQEGSRIFGEKTTELVGKSISLNLDGKTLVAPGVSTPLTEGGVSIPGFALEPAREYAIMLRSGAMPYGLELTDQLTGDPILGKGVQEKLIIALFAVFLLVALWLVIRQRLGGLVSAWMLLVQLALSYFLAALMRAGFNLVTLAGIWLGFLALTFAILVLFDSVQHDIRRGRSVRQAIKESYAGRGHGGLDALAALLVLCVVLVIVDAQGVVGSFAKVLGLNILVALVLYQVCLRLVLNETLTLFGDHSGLYASGATKKEEQ